MSRQNTPKFHIGYGWSLGENPGTQPLDEMRLIWDAAIKTDFAYNPILSNGLNYHYFGGVLFNQYGVAFTYPAGSVALTDNNTNYIYRVNQNVMSNITGFPINAMPMGIVTTLNGLITEQWDVRPSDPTSTQLRYISNNSILPTNTIGGVIDQIGEYLKILLGGLRRSYLFEQTTPSDTWVINHNLNQNPSVYVVDNLGNQLIAEIDYTNLNTVTISFSSPQTGNAHLIYAVATAQMVFEQLTPATEWIIIHNLGVNPLVDITDLSGNVIAAQVTYTDANTIRIAFNSPATGRAFLRT